MIPPWLIPYRKKLNEVKFQGSVHELHRPHPTNHQPPSCSNQDGIMDDSDFMYIQDFQVGDFSEYSVARIKLASRMTTVASS